MKIIKNKNATNLLLIFSVLVLILVFYLIYKHTKESFTEYNNIELPTYAFGNVLSSYFYYLTKAYSENKNLYITNYNNSHFKELRKLLPREIIIYNKYVYDSNSNDLNSVSPASIWNKIKLLQNIIPILKDNILFKKNKKYSKDCIIHYRCSDIPFVRQHGYHLLKFKWYKNAIKECFKKTSINKIYILNCNNHLSNDKNKNKCIEWCDLLINYINSELNIKAIQMCNNIEKDILYMLNSKCLISSGSSLSFSLGMLSDNIFVYPSYSTDYERRGCTDKQLRKNSICLEKDFIKHKGVKDYYKLDNSLFYT